MWLDGFEQVTYPHSLGLTQAEPVKGVVWHCTVGWCAQHAFNVYAANPSCPNITAEYAGTNGGADTTRYIRKRAVQHVPLSMAAYALQRGNKDHPCGVQTNRAGVVQIERVGFPSDNVTVDEHRWLGEAILAPILRACPGIPPYVFQGLGRMNEAEWSAWPGGQARHANVCCQPDGHSDPPELDLDLVLHFALEFNDSLLPKGDDDMVILVADSGIADGVFAYNGTHLRWVNDGNEYAMLMDDIKAKVVSVSDVKLWATIHSTSKVGGAPTSGKFAGAW